jgi:DNA replication and repair protein RecF
MQLQQLSLQHFRSYDKATFPFDKDTTILIGQNTAGKTNVLEAITYLSTGKSFRAEKEVQVIQHGQFLSRISAKVDEMMLEAVFMKEEGREDVAPKKRYLVNGVPKRRVDFAGILKSVLFIPADLDIVSGSPGMRRGFLDSVLEQTDRDYRHSLSTYQRALRQRNALLEHAQETGRRNTEQFSYWDELLISHGQLLSQRRREFINYLNEAETTVLPFAAVYDASAISEERLLQYKDAEIGAGVTLVGPHRDDVKLFLRDAEENHDAKAYGSRGQQRLIVLQLKLLQLSFMERVLSERPLLLLDDIFSELDSSHIELIWDIVGRQQTILTTTHEEFVPGEIKKKGEVITLSK